MAEQPGFHREFPSEGLGDRLPQSIPVIKYSNLHGYGEKQYPESVDEASHAAIALPHLSGTIVVSRAQELRAGSESQMPNENIRTKTDDQLLSCSVCTEDFTEIDDVRVLPCNHIYHRDCVDPWLLDFAGTCPLWIDLRNTIFAHSINTTADPPLSSSSAPAGVVPSTTQVSAAYRRLSQSIDSYLLSNTRPEEPIAALQRLRPQNLPEQTEAASMASGRRLKEILRAALRSRGRATN